MTDYDEIASRIADVIISPDTAIGFIHGIMSVPLDLGYLAYGIFDTESHYAHQTETIRITEAIIRGILNHDRITEAVEIIFKEFDKYVSESKQNEIYGKTISSVVGRAVTNSIISSKIAAAIAQRTGLLVSLRGGMVGNILLIGGMKERCIRASEQLSSDEPELYASLRIKDYDLLYFLFEPALKPFVDALKVRRLQGMPAFNNILQRVASRLSRHHE